MSNCKHDFEVMDIVYSRKENGRYNYAYRRVTTYYCTKCLEEESRENTNHLKKNQIGTRDNESLHTSKYCNASWYYCS